MIMEEKKTDVTLTIIIVFSLFQTNKMEKNGK